MKEHFITRRGFLRTSLSFSILASGGVAVLGGTQLVAADRTSDDLGAWVTITSEDQVTIRFGSTEMGQGVNTALPMILAEELDANWVNVSVEQVHADPSREFGNPGFGGALFTAASASVEGYFDILRKAGATARRILLHSVADAWSVPVAEVTTDNGLLVHHTSGRTMRYGEAATSLVLVTDVPAISEADLKPRENWRILGTDVQRHDIPAKTRGEKIYSIDVHLANMAFATQLLAPVEGENPVEINDTDVRETPGVIDIVALEGSVAILAESWEAAMTARDALVVVWSESSDFRAADSSDEMKMLRAAVLDDARAATIWEDRGNAVASIREAETRFSAEFATNYVYHAQMEPLNAIASVDADGKGAEIWLGTQSQSVTIGVAAAVLQTTPDRIHLHATQMGGAFGRRTVFARDMLRDALILSRRLGRPVKLMWTREDDVKNGWFRPPTAHRLDAVMESDGTITAMRHRVAAPSIMEFAFPQRWDPEKRLDPLVIEGSESRDYDISNFRAEHIVTPRQARLAAWRGIGWGPNSYAREAFIDILAEEANKSPLDFRRRLLRNNSRGLAVLETVAQVSGYGSAPDGFAHGIAFAGYKETYGAGVAEVTIEDGRFRVTKFWAAVDPGIVVHPDNYVAQVEGAVQFAISSLSSERISLVNGEVQQNNFYDYELSRIWEAPAINVTIVQSGHPPSGGGEIGVPMTGAAVANAIRALTGETPSEIPFGVTQKS